ncbi:hypothetical protein SAV31267_076940 [Streptomyces avermitilis]|uniref:Uncharacterized protein n=1 Tax=Streptomyces avermitilis TaxID=33903 RepID=A0A4D4N401_STRAX|nr:hypothetical protein SAV31267_076940 [Streptomyces avermitilis]
MTMTSSAPPPDPDQHSADPSGDQRLSARERSELDKLRHRVSALEGAGPSGAGPSGPGGTTGSGRRVRSC